ncbi:hypothetical protein MES5069_480039 [Mesorhizobium escarrei]|uniref:Uncharacterized protein n=1 Tax=Mesorhizobium escarrei TaxID=666018 RepID=A0ABM9E908_9HYPH|nr:hypothetical protein MES5069_480039 [Mesorhizobium escarrei]
MIAANMIFRCPSETPSSCRSACVICGSARKSTSFRTNVSVYLPRPSWLSQSSIVCMARGDPHCNSDNSANIVAAPCCRSEARCDPSRAHFSTHQGSISLGGSASTQVLHNQIALGPGAFSEQDESNSKATSAAKILADSGLGDEAGTRLIGPKLGFPQAVLLGRVR